MVFHPPQTSWSWSLVAGERGALSLCLALILLAAIATADWYIGLDVSLGALYVLPILLLGTVMPRPQVLVAAILCATLRMGLGHEGTWLEASLSFALASAAYAGAGFFVSEL